MRISHHINSSGGDPWCTCEKNAYLLIHACMFCWNILRAPGRFNKHMPRCSLKFSGRRSDASTHILMYYEHTIHNTYNYYMYCKSYASRQRRHERSFPTSFGSLWNTLRQYKLTMMCLHGCRHFPASVGRSLCTPTNFSRDRVYSLSSSIVQVLVLVVVVLVQWVLVLSGGRALDTFSRLRQLRATSPDSVGCHTYNLSTSDSMRKNMPIRAITWFLKTLGTLFASWIFVTQHVYKYYI